MSVAREKEDKSSIKYSRQEKLKLYLPWMKTDNAGNVIVSHKWLSAFTVVKILISSTCYDCPSCFYSLIECRHFPHGSKLVCQKCVKPNDTTMQASRKICSRMLSYLKDHALDDKIIAKLVTDSSTLNLPIISCEKHKTGMREYFLKALGMKMHRIFWIKVREWADMYDKVKGSDDDDNESDWETEFVEVDE